MDKKLEARIARLERLVSKSNRKPTLEQRIARLENAIKLKKTRKFESFESDLDEAGARAKADQMAREFASVTGMARLTPRDSGKDVIVSPSYGWLSVDRTDEIADDPDCRFAFEYSNNKFTIEVYPTDETVTLLNDYGEPINPKNGRVLTGYDEDISDPFVGAFPLSVWANAKLRGIKSTKEITPEDRMRAEFFGKAHNFEPDEIAKLVNKGYDVNMQDPKTGETAMMAAILQGNYKIVEYLLEAGADPNIKDKYGRTALKMANTYQKTHPHDIIGTLKSYGAHE